MNLGENICENGELLYCNIENLKLVDSNLEKDEIKVIYYCNDIEMNIWLDKQNRTCPNKFNPNIWLCNHCNEFKKCKSNCI